MPSAGGGSGGTVDDAEQAFRDAVGFTAFLKVNYRAPCLLFVDDNDSSSSSSSSGGGGYAKYKSGNKKGGEGKGRSSGGQRSGKRFAAGDPGEAALCVVTARDVKTEGRKMFLRAELASCDGQVVFADAESLYVQPRKK